MGQFVALLRAINVGGHTVKMDMLRDHFTGLGLANVATYIASGNVLFDAGDHDDAMERRIEVSLQAALGYEVLTFLRKRAEMADIAARRPFDAAETAEAFGLMVAFLKATPDGTATERLLAFRRASDDFAVIGREVYWLRRTQQSETNFVGSTLERAINAPATIRNMTTVSKIAALMAG